MGALYLTIAALFLLQLHFAVLSIKSFDWLAYVDHDLIYQAAHFASVDIGMADVGLMNTQIMDYGSELKWLAIAYNGATYLGLKSTPLHAYYFLSIFHILCACAALLIMGHWLIGRRAYLALGSLLLVVLFSPAAAIYLGFVKPGPNVVLLCIIAGAVFLFRYRKGGPYAYLLAGLSLAALGTAVKWFSAFLIFPALWIELGRLSRSGGDTWDRKPVYFALTMAVPILLAIIVVSSVLGTIEKALVAGETIPSLLARVPGLSITYFELFASLHSARSFWFGLVIVGLVFWGGYLLSKGYERGKWPGLRFPVAFFRIAAPYSIALLVFYLPLLFAPEQLIVSFAHFSQYNLAAGGDFGRGGESFHLTQVIGNLGKWLEQARADGLIGIPFLLLGALGIYNRKRSASSLDMPVRELVLFLICLVIPLFLFVTKVMDAAMVMIFLIVIFAVSASAGVLPRPTDDQSGPQWRNFRILQAVFGLLVLAQIVTQNNASIAPVWKVYKERRALEADIHDLQSRIQEIIGSEAAVYLCERDVPLVSESLATHRMTASECLAQDPSLAISSGAWLVLNGEQHERVESEFQISRTMQLQKRFVAQAPGRNGYRVDRDIFVLRKHTTSDD